MSFNNIFSSFHFFICMIFYLFLLVFDGQSNKILITLWCCHLWHTCIHCSRYSWLQMISRSTLSDFLDNSLLYRPEICSHPKDSVNQKKLIKRLLKFLKLTLLKTKDRFTNQMHLSFFFSFHFTKSVIQICHGAITAFNIIFSCICMYDQLKTV